MEWKTKGPIPRWRAYLESIGKWDEEKQKALEVQAKEDIVNAFKEGERKKKGPLRELFTDVFTDMPWNLEEQWQQTEKHVREYAADYNLSKYRDLEGPVPAMDTARALSRPRRA